MRTCLTRALRATLIAFVLAPPGQRIEAAQVPKFTEWVITSPGGSPHEIVWGADGRLWFTEYYQDHVGSMGADGSFQHYSTGDCHPYGIARFGRTIALACESTGRLGFTSVDAPSLGFTSPDLFTLPTSIVFGPDGRLWITQAEDPGPVYAYEFLSNSPPSAGYAPGEQLAGIAVGPDGRIWYTDRGANTVGACSPDGGGCVTFDVPTPASEPTRITAGKDGALWFTERAKNKIGRVTPSGVFTEYPVPTPGSQPFAIVAGNDGNIWFTEREGSKIGRITPPRFDKNGAVIDAGGVITEFTIPTPFSGPETITNGPDGNIWFGEFFAGKIGRLRVHIPGDVDESGIVNVSDVLYFINFLFAGGPAPK